MNNNDNINYDLVLVIKPIIFLKVYKNCIINIV